MRAAAVITALLFLPAAASAHGTGPPAPQAADRAAVEQDADSAACGLDCTIPATGHGLHCHLASIPPMAAGLNQSLDDDQPVTAAPAAPTLAAQNSGTHSTPASRIPAAVLSRFILFGNFRS